jgi:hypothetical protein
MRTTWPSLPRGLPAIEQHSDFVLASDERCEARTVHGVEAALGAAFA